MKRLLWIVAAILVGLFSFSNRSRQMRKNNRGELIIDIDRQTHMERKQIEHTLVIASEGVVCARVRSSILIGTLIIRVIGFIAGFVIHVFVGGLAMIARFLLLAVTFVVTGITGFTT